MIEEWGTSATHGSLTGQGGGEAGGTSARINMVYFGNQRDEECSTEGGIAIAHARDNMAKHQKVGGKKVKCRRGEKAKQDERESLRSEVKRNVQSTNLGGGEAGPSVGNASVGGDHLQHFLGIHLTPRRAQGIPDIGF